MRFIEAELDSPVIVGLTRTIEEDRCTLRWKWPGSLQAVYISRTYLEHGTKSDPAAANMKLYTKAEYKANNGYHSRIEGIGRLLYTVYAYQEGESEPLLILQPEGDNAIEVSAGKAQIRYTVIQKTNWLRKYKSIQIQVISEVPIAQDVLCYVKKQGGYPLHKEDGTLYPFTSAFAPGKNLLPEIEIGKQDYIRLFFTDGREYGQLYELIQEN